MANVRAGIKGFIPIDPLVRLMSAVVIADDGCWNWLKSTDGSYGIIWLNGRKCKAHRASYLFHVGPIPEGMLVCHKCDNRLCINPDHLFIGNWKSNLVDCANKMRVGGQRISVDEAKAIPIRYKNGESLSAIAAEFGVSLRTVQWHEHRYRRLAASRTAAGNEYSAADRETLQRDFERDIYKREDAAGNGREG